MAENVTKKKRLNMNALSMLDNIIERGDVEEDTTPTDDDNTPLDEMSLELDSISITANEMDDDDIEDALSNGSLDDITKALDSILLSSKARKQSQAGSKPQPQPQPKANKPKSATSHPEVVRNSNLGANQYLNVDDVIYTTNGSKVSVVREIPSFENIPAYITTFMNKRYIMKWYNKDSCRDLKVAREYYETISKDTQSPKYVLKPKAITKPQADGCFGCVYTEINHEYFALKDIINGYATECDSDVESKPIRKKVKFKNVQAMVTSCINIASIFSKLNEKKAHIYAFSDEDIFININTGDVLWDVVNSISVKKNADVKVDTMCTYLAPEILNGSYVPNVHSNNHTLAVILFRILFHDHPLEGKALIDDVSLNFAKKMRFYSDHAVFIFDPNDTSNRAVRGVNYTVISMWEKYPKYLRELFIDTFCEYMFSPDKRYSADDWVKSLLHLKSDILPCICGRTDFAFLYEFTHEAFYKCQRCGSKYHSLYFIKRKFNIPIYTGNSIYTTFVKDNIANVEEVMGVVIDNKIHTNLNGLKNVSNLEWKCTNSSGNLKVLNKEDVLPIFEGTVIDVGGSIAQFDFIM